MLLLLLRLVHQIESARTHKRLSLLQQLLLVLHNAPQQRAPCTQPAHFGIERRASFVGPRALLVLQSVHFFLQQRVNGARLLFRRQVGRFLRSWHFRRAQ